MKSISLQVIHESVSKIKNLEQESFLHSYWFWLSIVELIIIIMLLTIIIRKQTNLKFSELSNDKMKIAKSTEIDMENLMNSINSSKELYKELSRVCHPDRYINSDKQSIAENIFQEISKNKRNYKALQELKNRAISELEITFK